MIPVDGSSRLIRWVVSMPPGRGQREVHQDDVGRRLEGAVDGAPRILGLGDDLEVRLATEDVGDAHPEQGVVVDDEDPA